MSKLFFSKTKQKVWVHTLIFNEENFVWFAIMSVVDSVDKVLVWDTGSTDKTVEIVKEIIKLKGNKVELKQVGRVDKNTLPIMRQAMIDVSSCDWIMLVDGDEIWSKVEVEKLLNSIKGAPPNLIAFFNRTRNCIGDIFHYLPEKSGEYKIKGIEGHLNIRLIKKTKDLRLSGQYPLESFVTSEGSIEKQDENLEFVDAWYLHTSFLQRSDSDQNRSSGSLGRFKIWERGIRMKQKEIPEVLFILRPDIVKDPLIKRGFIYEMLAVLLEPLVNLKRL